METMEVEFKGYKYPQPKKEDINGVTVMTDRLEKLKEEWENAPQQIYVDDTILFTESWKETEGLPKDYRWAKAFEKRMLNCPIIIREGELIVGSTTKFVRGANTLCAAKPREILKFCETGQFDRKSSDIASSDITPEDLQALKEDAEYWIPRIPEKNFVTAQVEELMDEETLNCFMDRAGIFEGRAPRVDPDRGIFQNYGAFANGDGGPTPMIMNAGLNEVIRSCEEELDRIEREGIGVTQGLSNQWGWRKFWFLKSMILTCNALIAYAQRYSDLAAEQAKECKDPIRKAELEKIADVCAHVPGNAPRDFWEAVQWLRFVHMCLYKESPERPAVPMGGIDRMFGPYLDKDLAEGKITLQEAAELLGALWLKTRENEQLVTIKRNHRAAPGTLLPDVTICGLDENGMDETNTVSWLALEVMRQMRLSEPTIYIRYHKDMDKEFLTHALECNRDFGGGNPAFLNYQLGTQRYLERGVPLSDAAYWTASGCLGYHMDRAQHMAGILNLNLPKVFEVMLNDGVDPITGLRCAPELLKASELKNWEEVKEAYFTYLDYFMKKMRQFYLLWFGSEEENGPMSSYTAALYYPDTIKWGMGMREGANPYNVCRVHWLGDRGLTDIADDLAGIRYVVDDKKLCTLPELIEAMRNNWEGHEDLQAACHNAPKYGNDDPYVDDIFAEIAVRVPELFQSRPDIYSGEKPMLFKGAASGHVVSGKLVGALPNGRVKGEPLNDAGTSAGPGADVNGPTANVNSATVVQVAKEYCGCAHNMRFTRGVVNSPEKIEKLFTLLNVYFKRGGWHIQFNMLDDEELRDAKVNPEKHKDLCVRVGGYAAYFVDLPWELQDEIISRTAHEI